MVAVEAEPQVFDLLRDNAGLNDDRFLCRQAALWSEPDARVTLVAHS